jgi:hypothetical protein
MSWIRTWSSTPTGIRHKFLVHYTEYNIYCGFINHTFVYHIFNHFNSFSSILTYSIQFSSNLPTLYNVEKIVWPTVYAIFSVLLRNLLRINHYQKDQSWRHSPAAHELLWRPAWKKAIKSLSQRTKNHNHYDAYASRLNKLTRLGHDISRTILNSFETLRTAKLRPLLKHVQLVDNLSDQAQRSTKYNLRAKNLD